MGISFRRELGHDVMCASHSTKMLLPEPHQCHAGPCSLKTRQISLQHIAQHSPSTMRMVSMLSRVSMLPLTFLTFLKLCATAFFERAVHGHDGVISWAAVHR